MVWLYEKYSRDNIEGNLRFPFMADQRFKEIKMFYPSGDEMFLEATCMLDSSGEPRSVTDTGWNIYRKCDKRSEQ